MRLPETLVTDAHLPDFDKHWHCTVNNRVIRVEQDLLNRQGAHISQDIVKITAIIFSHGLNVLRYVASTLDDADRGFLAVKIKDFTESNYYLDVMATYFRQNVIGMIRTVDAAIVNTMVTKTPDGGFIEFVVHSEIYNTPFVARIVDDSHADCRQFILEVGRMVRISFLS